MLLNLFLVSLLACVRANVPIYFGFVATDDASIAELTPSLDIALSTINNSSTVLPGYQLSYVPWHSECDRTISLKGFLEHVLERCNGSSGGPTILGVIGCGCTEADRPVAEQVHYWSIPQISYGATSFVKMEDRQTRFPNYFLMYSMENWGKALQGVLSAFDWRRVAVLTDNSTRFLRVGEIIRSYLNTSEFNTTQKHITLDTAERSVEESLNSSRSGDEFRIFFLNTYSETAREILCYAATQGLVFPRYAWIVYGWYSSDWWVTSQTGMCSNDVIERFLEDSRVLALQPYQTPERGDDSIIGGITRAEYYSRYKAAQEASGVSFVPESPLIYDAVWTLALALNTTIANQIPASNSCSSGLPLKDFTYSSDNLGNEIKEAVTMTSFTGASGEVIFNQVGVRQMPYVTVLQYRSGRTVEVGRVNVSADQELYNLTYAANENRSTIFPGVTPMDGTPVKVITTFDAWIVGLCYTLAVIGLIFTFICFLFNIVFRKRRIVRLTSPNLNYFILLGGVFICLAIFVRLIQTTDLLTYKIHCYLQTWAVTLGFTLAFGTVIAKHYRVLYIFKNPSPHKRTLKDWKLMIIIFVVVGIGVVLLLLELIVPIFRIEPFLIVNRDNPSGLNELGITEIYCSFRCIGGDPVDYYYEIIYYTYILLILAISLILAIMTRKVKIKVLNDSKWVSAIVYFVAPSTILFFSLNSALIPWVHISAMLYAIGLFLSLLMFLGFTFIPKMVALAKDPKGEKIFENSTNFSAHSTDIIGTGNGVGNGRQTAQNTITRSSDTAISPSENAENGEATASEVGGK